MEENLLTNNSLNLKLELENKELSDSEKATQLYNLLNNYINSNLSEKKDYSGNLEELKKLSLFYNGDFNAQLLELLLRNNTILSNIIRSVVISNFYILKTNKINDIVNSKFILALIDFYQSLYPKKMETIDLFFRVYSGDKNARNKIILNNTKMVDYIANKYVSSDIDLNDLISEGMIGLIKAVDNFKLSKNVEFSTYAFSCVEGYIKRFIDSQCRNIRIPIYKIRELDDYNKKVLLLEQKLGRKPYVEEISKELEIDTFDISMFHMLNQDTISLNSFITINGDGTVELENLIPADPVSFIDSDLNDEATLFNRLLYTSNLSINQIYILIYHYGLEDVDGNTFEEIGKKAGVVREDIRQIEASALRKIKKLCKKNNPNVLLSQNNLQFTPGKYSTRKIFGIHKNKVIQTMPIPTLNKIVRNIIYYNLLNNNHLLKKRNKKNNSTVKFHKIDNNLLNIISSFILEYDKIAIYDSLMDLDFNDIKIFELNYEKNTNPKYLFINENFSEVEKNKFLELFSIVVKNLQESTLVVDNIYSYFNRYTVEQIDEILEDLTEYEINLLHLRFGKDLKKKVIYPLSEIQRNQIENIIRKLEIALINRRDYKTNQDNVAKKKVKVKN